MSAYQSPLRYPGGKRKLANFIKLLLRGNNLLDGEYAEVYAGGAAVALDLLFGRYVSRIRINDYDPGVYAFWRAATDETAELCRRIDAINVSIEEWERQRVIHASVQEGEDIDLLDAALSTFFLNRTNRSGIISGGVIGGKGQSGKWKIDARFNKPNLIRRIEKIGRHRSQIEVTGMDGADFLAEIAPALPERSLVYLDPPYYVKGQQMLYANYYKPEDHATIYKLVNALERPWLVSYDDVEEIRNLYAEFRSREYDIFYSAQDRYQGREIAFFADDLYIPEVDDPAKLKTGSLRQLERGPVLADHT